MKKTYFTPIARTIDLTTESPLLTNSDPTTPNEGYDSHDALSNRRNSIWGDED